MRPNVAQPFHLPISRSMATETLLPTKYTPSPSSAALTPAGVLPLEAQSVLTTIYRFPTMEPLRYTTYPATHLRLPLRRDLLHRAIVFEGDATRQGTASTKTRYEVHGSNRKIRPQKGTGRARLGDKKSPMLRGGGVAHGPKPRDFSTELPRKMYDLAWRTALSYRYSRGELIVVDSFGDTLREGVPQGNWFKASGWGRPGDGKSLVITMEGWKMWLEKMKGASMSSTIKTVGTVDVKDLLKLARVVVEKRALDKILKEHRSDLTKVRRGRIPRALSSASLLLANESALSKEAVETGEMEGEHEFVEANEWVDVEKGEQEGDSTQASELETTEGSQKARGPEAST
ncbi:54S ribosomal protein yml6, mitochondrial [Coniosporium apollinis]|uniref:Large ribosomal subunit protein uL4m n=1 Tax=Coniosporium apollinis TaxID=61459 RepID=A0ABQ9NP41_9PEZI|nr:54S ribosomal protein yml6, mitochondrial [Coniosporium apollinis]